LRDVVQPVDLKALSRSPRSPTACWISRPAKVDLCGTGDGIPASRMYARRTARAHDLLQYRWSVSSVSRC